MILWFDEIGAKDIPRAGGKGANLGEMALFGFPVPPGFCVTTDAYREHVSGLKLEEWIGMLSGGNDGESTAGESTAGESTAGNSAAKLEEIAGILRKRIEDAPIAERTADLIRNAYQRLAAEGTSPVAVRSSATAEDLPGASFAGQQETFLSVAGEQNVLRSVKKCWASLWTARSIAYRQHAGFDHDSVSLAVVVQIMVPSEKSGVLFTVNPLTGSEDEMLVNASYGLGESIVSGKVTPDSCRLSKKGRLVVERRTGLKEVQCTTGPDGLTRYEPVPKELRDRFCLNEKELQQLLALGKKVEAHCQVPQDIEWAFAGGTLYLLQARPVTAIAVIRETADRTVNRTANRTADKAGISEKIQQKLLDNFMEHIPDPPYPIDYEIINGLNTQKNKVIRGLGLTMPQPRKMVVMDENGLLSVGRLLPHPNIRLLLLPFSVLRGMRIDKTGSAAVTERRLDERLAEQKKVLPAKLNGKELAGYIEDTVSLAMRYTGLRFSAYAFPMGFLGFRLKFYSRIARLEEPVSQYDFLSGLIYKTAEIDNALFELADTAGGIPCVRGILLGVPAEEVLPALNDRMETGPFLERYREFLSKYGARTAKAYIPFSTESWLEDPASLLKMLASIIKSGIGKQEEKRRSAEGKYEFVRDMVSGRLPVFLRRSFQKTLDDFRYAHLGRERLLYQMEQCFVLMRAGSREASARMQDRGMINDMEDIKYLLLSELLRVLAGDSSGEEAQRTIVKRKGQRRRAEVAWKGIGSSASPFGSAGKGTGTTGILKGLSGSPGIAEGPARIIDSPGAFDRLQKGDVLVCRFTDPAWTPLFSIASGVVCDTGGPLSHAAIVAREYGIPAVLGIPDVSSVLRDGQPVLVDGSAGTVAIIDKMK